MTEPSKATESALPPYRYDFATIEAKWQNYWAEHRTFNSANPGDANFDPQRHKFYVLDMFPYPSGVGLHVGHPLGYIATDIVARYKRMTGYNVLHPIGFDAFGLPAEQYAIEHGVHPRTTTEKNIANMIRQLKAIGLSFDWDRCVSTTDEKYYKWTQWIFLQLYHSYFDPWKNKARPISDLMYRLESGELVIAPDDSLQIVPASGGLEALGGLANAARKWHEIEPDEQRRILDSYRLAYLDEVPVNWCPQLGTVLANEEVTQEGRSERGNYPVYRRPLRQWMLRITDYAERLLEDLEILDWPEPIKMMQRNWIGRSTGAEIEFPIDNFDDSLLVYTTRPDTIFGVTYMVLAPEHPLAELDTEPCIVSADQRDAVATYQKQAAEKTDVDRQAETKTKTGVFTGSYAINPMTGAKIPIWIADYVMMGYGTGAIMAVPGQDQRDWDFAKQFDLPIIRTVQPPDDFDGEAYTGEGPAIHSATDAISLNGLEIPEAKAKIIEHLEAEGIGRARTQYKLRDWLFSRQRYWGEPFPILHELDAQGKPTGRIEAVTEDELPVSLPQMNDFRPEASDDPDLPPRPPLARADASWRIVEKDGVRYERELNTMPQWAGSCWYYLRYLDPNNEDRFVAPDVEAYWMRPSADQEPDANTSDHNMLRQPGCGGVDLYVGGVEHAVLHLLYARFWHKVLYDLYHVSTPEPFGRLFNQGYIQAYCYRDQRGIAVPAEQVVDQDGQPAMEVQDQPGRQFFHNSEPVTQEYGKMGKSLKNAVNPDDIFEQFGCDTLRLYEMYMGPLDASKPWNTRDIVGVHRFLQRLWRNFVDEQTGELTVTDDEPKPELMKLLHKTIDRVTRDMQRLNLNTVIAGLIELNNTLVAEDHVPRAVAEPMVLMLAPLAPHIAEELWQRLGHDASLAYADWPTVDPQWLIEDEVEIVVQILGKVRGRVTVPADAAQQQVEQVAMNEPRIAEMLEGKTVRKVIYVPGKLLNIVAN